jgi:NTP pyrophosphatase (non-canonical NTP hydrolase)
MNWTEYSKLALRTESIPINTYGAITLGKSNQEEPCEKATRLLHAAMGLVTETQEIETYRDKVNLIEEIGDCFWYIPIIADVIPKFNIQPVLAVRLASGSPEYNLRACRRYAAELIDLIGKRHIFYGKELDLTKVVSAAESYTYYLVRYCTVMQIDLEHTWEANIKKLEKRYPDLRFNGEHAVNRNVANELSHIEEAVDMESKDQAYTEPTSVDDQIKLNWEILKTGIQTDLVYHADPDKVAVAVLEYLNCSEDHARILLGEEFERCRFTIVHDGDKQILTAVPLKFKEADEDKADAKAIEERSAEPTYEVALDGQGILEVTAKGFNSILRNDFTPNEIERIAMGLSFELGNKFKAAGMDILATAMGGVYREYSGRGDKLADNTVFGMYEMMGYPKTMEGILAIANSILRKPKDASDNSSAG